MSDRHWQSRSWPRPALATSVLAMAGVAALAGCSGSASSSAGSASPADFGTASATAQAVFSAAQLKAALLTKVNGKKPAAAAESGDYGSLPDVQTSKQTMNGVKVTPAKCATASQTGLKSSAFTKAPASVVTFRVGNDGVSEVLVSAQAAAAATAFGDTLPAGCSHYSTTVDGKTLRYTVRESAMSGLAEQARALNVKASGYASVDVWSVVYRGAGFVGAVTMAGPDATKADVTDLAKDAYSHAAESLTQ
jgi:hypothetical protein